MHLKPENALDLLEKRLDKVHELSWNQHLQGCKDCAKILDHWRELRSGLKRSHLRSAPSEDLRHAEHIFPSAPESGGSKLRRLFATLVFDSFLQTALAGTRGSGASRQLVLRSEILVIHIKVWGERGHRQLMGQLMLHTNDRFREKVQCHLLQEGKKLETTTVEELGEFHFTRVPDGDVTLEIDLPTFTIIGALDIGTTQ